MSKKFRPLREGSIIADNPFADDKLDRHICATNLMNVVKSMSTPSVIAITSPWGGGKSFFATRWVQLLRNDGFEAIVFNAWKNDYVNNPLVAFIDHIESEIKNSSAWSSVQATFDGLKSQAIKFMALGGKVAVEYATRGALTRVLEKEESDAFTRIAMEYAENEIHRQKAIRDVVDEFRKSLAKFAGSLVREGRPLVVVIDELDRCRPNYAIELLEMLKHVWSVEGVVYVLAIDRDQLFASIQGAYGANIDGDAYFRRFVDLSVAIPKPDMLKYCNHLVGHYQIQDDDKNLFGGASQAAMGRSLPELCESLGFVLREVDQIFARLDLIRRMSAKPMWHYVCDSIILMVIIQELDQNIYSDMIEDGGAIDAARRIVRDQRFDRARKGKYFRRALGQAIAMLVSDDTQLPAEAGLGNDSIVKEGYESVLGSFHRAPGHINRHMLKTYIEMAGTV